MSVLFFHTFVIPLYQFLRNGKLTLSYSYTWQKFNKMNEERSQGYQSAVPEYVTWQINSHILQLLLRPLYRSKILICCSLIKHFPNNQKDILAICKYQYCIEWLLKKVYLAIYKSLKNSYLKKVFVP